MHKCSKDPKGNRWICINLLRTQKEIDELFDEINYHPAIFTRGTVQRIPEWIAPSVRTYEPVFTISRLEVNC